MIKLKVAQIVTRMDWAGPPDIIRTFCESLDRDRYDIRLITGPTKNPSCSTVKFLEEFRDNVITIPWLIRDVNPVFDILALVSLCRIMARERFDIIHTHTSKAGALGRLAAYLCGSRRTVHMSHGHIFYGYFSPLSSGLVVLIERFLSALTAKFTVFSESEKSDLMKFAVSAPDKVTVVTSGFDLGFKNTGAGNGREKKRQLGFGDSQRMVGMVSRLEPVKGAEYFVSMACKIAETDTGVSFIIVGEGSLRGKLENMVKERGLGGRIMFTGWRDDVLDIISFLDILVQPSLNEAVGRVLIEAQGLGVPVVAAHVGGIPEVVRHGVTGLLVPPGNADELTAATLSLLRNDDMRSEMSARAKEWVDDKFSAKKMVAEIDSVYREVMAQ